MDAHLVCVPSLGTLTARSLTGGDLQVLGGQADGALDAELLVLGTVDELLADLLERLDVAGGEGDADLVDLGHLALLDLLGIVGGHVCGSFFWGDWAIATVSLRVSRWSRGSCEGFAADYIPRSVCLDSVT